MSYQKLSKKTWQIFNILTNKTLYDKPLMDESIFNTDLVIKMKFPVEQYSRVIDKNKYNNLDAFVINPDSNLLEAHRMAYEKLVEQLTSFEQKVQAAKNQNKEKKIMNPVIFKKVHQNESSQQEQQTIEKKYQVSLGQERDEEIVFYCQFKCDTYLMDRFTLNYNTLMYVLQKKCGFITSSLIVNEKGDKDQELTYVYILLTQNTSNLLKGADRFKIKKQIDYSQIDLFFNQPVDQKGRPYQNSSCIKKYTIKSGKLQKIAQNNNKLQKDPTSDKSGINVKKAQTRQTNLNQKGLPITDKSKDKMQKDVLQFYKRIHRNMNNKSYHLNQQIIDEKQMSTKNETKLVDYLEKFFSGFDEIMREEIKLTSEQKNYIHDFNREKINPKCQNEYILKLKRKRLFELLAQLSKQGRHQVHKTPIAFFPFVLPSRKLSFIERIRGILLYEQYKVSPYGDLSLFSKMDRIKIAYLNLKQYIRVDNLQSIDCDVFALHDDFQRYGIPNDSLMQRKSNESVKGGINGKNILQSWKPLTPWKVQFVTLRNYFGQDTAYQVYLKTHLILYFMVITPLGILGQIISRIFIYYNAHYTFYKERGFSSTHKQQLIFHLVFFALAISIYAYFLQSWLNKQIDFQDNFAENQTQITFRYEYKGPYIRNKITDSVNQYKLDPSRMSLLMKILGFLLILIILGAQCAFFYGIRMALVELSSVITRTNVYLISWPHILCYGLFFIFNYFFYRFVVRKLNQKMTSLQNLAVEDLHKDSFRSKNSLFMIGIELIPVIFLLIIEPFQRNSCYSSSCYDQFTQYIYSRYVAVFLLLGKKLLIVLYLYFWDDPKTSDTKDRQQSVTYGMKLLNYMQLIKSQSKKSQYESSIQDETEALLHYGIFVTSFPLSPFLGLANMILEYSVERAQFIVRNRRPIPKSQAIQNYSDNYKLIMHLSIFVNCWIIFFTLEEVQYSFQKLIRIFDSETPTYSGILTVKIFIIIIMIIIYEIWVQIIRFFVKQNQDKVINRRKKLKYLRHVLNKHSLQKSKPTLEVKKIHPFRTIFRTYHREVIQKTIKATKMLTQIQDFSQQPTSSNFIKGKKK